MHRIKNFKVLTKNPVRTMALQLAEVALESIETRGVIRRAVSFNQNEIKINDTVIPLEPNGRIFVVGVGKCSLEATLELEAILGERITDGVVIDVERRELPKRTRFYLGDHPFPTENNIKATAEIIKLLSPVKQDDLVIFVISGGGSVLLCQPAGQTIPEEIELTKHFFRNGASIGELNTVRKHLSLARGGYLAKAAYPARVVSLIFSDVPGNNLESISSGPTVKDDSTIEEAKRLIEKYAVAGESEVIIKHLIETPKEAKYFDRVTNLLLLTNETALQAMTDLASTLGLTPTIKNLALAGEARAVGEAIARELSTAPPGSVYLYGGETTVTIQNASMGQGGRNQELALGALPQLSAGECLLAIASDGVDNSDHAGALCDTITRERARVVGLDPVVFLNQNNSYAFFTAVGDYLETGYTGANVSDIIIALKFKT
jgi:glycerate-2-kinase